MKQKQFYLGLVYLISAMLCLGVFVSAQNKTMTRDQVFRTIAEKVITQADSPVTNVINAVDETIEISEIGMLDANGKVTVKVKERAAAGAPSLNREIKLVFVPVGENKWAWESFENDRKTYPIERLFPYIKNTLTSQQRAIQDNWNKILDTFSKKSEAATKVLDTAKAVIKQDPPQLAAVTQAKAAFAKARESGDNKEINEKGRALDEAIQSIANLPDTYQDLKANDAYLRLNDELKKTEENLKKALEDYAKSVASYNDTLQRIPYALGAYGMGFLKMEPVEVSQ